MTVDELAPLPAEEAEPFPCVMCSGSGVNRTGDFRCFECNGSGYGLPPAAVDRETSHCLERLRRWAHREPTPQED